MDVLNEILDAESRDRKRFLELFAAETIRLFPWLDQSPYPEHWEPWNEIPWGRNQYALWIWILESREHARIAYKPPKKKA